MRASNRWQNFYFWENCSLKALKGDNMNHILFFVYAVGRKHTCIDKISLTHVLLSLSWVCVIVRVFLCMMGVVISCSPSNPQMSDPFTPTKNSRSCVKKKGTTMFLFGKQCYQRHLATKSQMPFFCLKLIDKTEGAIRASLTCSLFIVVTRRLRESLQCLR